MKKFLLICLASFLLIILLLQIFFLVWLSNFISLYFESSQNKVGFVKDNVIFFYANSSPLATFLLPKKKLYTETLLSNKSLVSKQLCFKPNPRFAPFLKFKLACKLIQDTPNFLDKIFCKYPLLSFNMVQSCNIKEINVPGVLKGLEVIYINQKGFEIKDED